MGVAKLIKNGLVTNNPVFVQLLGMCPALAVTSSVFNGAGLGLATTAVVTCSNLIISLLRKVIPPQVRIPCYIIVIAGFVTAVQLLLAGFVPALNDALGIFIPLIVVNCLVLARAESFASKNGPISSIFDGIGMGLGFTVALSIIGGFRELLGSGTLLGYVILPESFPRTLIFILPPGAFFTLAAIIAFLSYRKRRSA